jgi:hypothetical protein
MKDQEKAFKDYLEQSNSEYEKFKEQEEKDFDNYQKEMQKKLQEMLDGERKAFTSKDGINYAIRPVDPAKLAKSEWVLWNQKKDKEVGW